jgi:hypothetical protein
MKNKKVSLLKWRPEESEYIEISWPEVHKTLGIDQTKWLLSQPQNVCQLVLERNGMFCSLVAEFYDEQALTVYHLMWAK